MKHIISTRTESFGDDEFQITNALLLISRPSRSFRFWKRTSLLLKYRAQVHTYRTQN
jgi:hypothetical protein